MKKLILILFSVFFCCTVNAQNFIPVWESNYLPDQESGDYVSVVSLDGNNLCVGRTSSAGDPVVFGDLFFENWLTCPLPDSLGEIAHGVAYGNKFYFYTESKYILEMEESCSWNIVCKSEGISDLLIKEDTIFIFRSGIYIADTLSPSLIHFFIPATGEMGSLISPETESLVSFVVSGDKKYCVTNDFGEEKILELEDSVWEVKYVFPEGEYFISWADGGDRIYVSSTSFSPPSEYGILSEFKDDGDMDSIFSSDGNILAIEATDCFVFTVGSFTNFGNCDAENFAMFERSTKEIVQTDRGLDGNGYSLSANEDFVYVGGSFTYGADIHSPGIISLPSCYEDGIEDLSESEVRIFPNPVTEFLVIENGAGKNIRIFSLSEEIYLMVNEVDNRKVFDCLSIPAGTYYILIEGKVFSFIKI